MKKALVLNALTRNSIAIARSLHRQGILVEGVAINQFVKERNEFFRKRKSKAFSTIWFIDKEEKLAFVKEKLKTGSFDYLFAGGTTDSLFIAQYKDTFSQYCKVASESIEKVTRVHDKLNCNREVAAIGIPVPKTAVLSSIESCLEDVHDMQPPFVLKFADSHASKGLKIFDGPKENFEAFLRSQFGANRELPLVQEKIEGSLVDTCAFSFAGKSKGVVAQKRILTAWINGGGGIVNETIEAPILIERTNQILEHFEWNGHLELDWMFDENRGEYYMIEINPKYWGTTQLTISSGLDFPLMSVKILDGEEVESILDYPVGLRYRWLDDEINTITSNYSSPHGGLKLWVGFVLRFFHHRTLYNTYFFSDSGPFRANTKMIFIKLIKRNFNRWTQALKNLVTK